MAERWPLTAGALAEFQPQETGIAVKLERRVHLRRRGNGRLQHSDSDPGTIRLCPAGRMPIESLSAALGIRTEKHETVE